jgi:hypothetical protein
VDVFGGGPSDDSVVLTLDFDAVLYFFVLHTIIILPYD